MKILIKSKKAFAPILALILLVGASIVLLSYSGVINTGSLLSSNGGYIQAPYYATISCTQSGASKSFSQPIATDGQWLNSQLPSNTNEWSIRLLSESGTLFSTGRRFEYYICPQQSLSSNCIRKFYPISSPYPAGNFDYQLGTISSDKYIWVQYQGQYLLNWRGRTGSTFEVTYKPFVLKRDDKFRGGVQEVSGAIGCEIPATDPAWTDRITSTLLGGVKIAPGSRTLSVGQDFNYISGTVTRMATGNVESNGQYCIYSNGIATLYPIKQLQTASYSYDVVDVTYSSGSQDCCSGDNTPDRTCVNGKWQSTQNAECSFINPCEGSEWRADLTTAKQKIRYECISGKCQAQTQPALCTKDSDCSTNMRCDTNLFACVMASTVGGAGVTPLATNEVDCNKQGNKWIPKTSTSSGGFLGFGGKTVIVEAHCEKPTAWWKQVLLIFSIIVLLIMFVKFVLPTLRHMLKGTPIGKFIP